MPQSQTNRFEIPIVVFIYRRPYLAAQVFEQIRRVKPTKLYVIADGPQNEDVRQACQETRALFSDSQIDWDCQIIRNFSDTNMGLCKRIQSGLGHVFESEDSAIILEDDCLPNESFFGFCRKMLDAYKDDKRIGAVAGSNFFQQDYISDTPYFFSRVFQCYGWATWSDRWSLYDANIHKWHGWKNRQLIQYITGSAIAAKSRMQEVRALENDRVQSWAYKFALSLLLHSMQCIIPRNNMVSNIGSGIDSTNSLSQNEPFSLLPTTEMDLNFEVKQDLMPPCEIYDSLFFKSQQKLRRFHKKLFNLIYINLVK